MEKIQDLMKEEQLRRKAKEATQRQQKGGEKSLTFYMPITETLCLGKWYHSLTMVRSFRIDSYFTHSSLGFLFESMPSLKVVQFGFAFENRMAYEDIQLSHQRISTMEFSLTDTPIQADFFRDLLNGSQFPSLNKIVIFFNATKSLDSLRAILAQDLSRIKSFHFNASGFQLRPNEGRDQSILSFLREHQLNEVVLKGSLFTQ